MVSALPRCSVFLYLVVLCSPPVTYFSHIILDFFDSVSCEEGTFR